MGKKLTTKEFIERAKAVHGEKYDYSEVDYRTTYEKVKIICLEHGVFMQTRLSHLSGNGCPECGKIRTGNFHRKPIEKFIEQSILIHGKKYDYSKVDYTTTHEKVIIHCPEHGNFLQEPASHLSGNGCPICAGNIVLNTKDFISRANLIHENKYDYSKTIYINGKTKVFIICPEHGVFKANPRNHLSGNGCQDCYDERRGESQKMTLEEFVENSLRRHSGKYSYEKFTYINARKKSTISCHKHGDFLQAPYSHLSGQGCPKCFNKSEGRIASYLEEKHIIHRRFYIENREFDFYLPDFDLLIERDGEQHYRDTTIRGGKIKIKKQQINDVFKTKLAKKHGYKIARIPYWLTEEEEHKEIENILAGKSTYPDVPDLKQATTKPKPK
jgi:very-short-patch-repair endonuclease